MHRSPRTSLVVAAVAVVLALLGTASPAGASQKITHGRAADPGEYPFMVSLQAPGFGHFCGGSLIDDEWVLTAAHCLGGEMDAVIGARDLSSGANEGTRVEVVQQVEHPGYDPEQSVNDIALLRLARAVPDPTITLASPQQSSLEAPGTQVTLTGWGGTSNDQDNQVNPTVLQEAEMPVLPESDCSGSGFETYDPDTLVCAGAPEDDADGGVDACQGDSGGPLFADSDGTRVQIGIVSYGPTCGHTPTAYTQVSAFNQFILETVGGAPVDETFPADAERISGANRYATAAAFAARGWDAPVPSMFLVTGTAYADALAVAPLAQERSAPVLLTAPDALPGETESIIRSLQPASVVIVGGTGAVSEAVADQVAAITGERPGRIAGASRYETAAIVSSRLAPDGLPEDFRSLFVASGESFADALGGAAAAAADPTSPLLLTQRDALPQETADEIARLQPESVYVLGGTAAVSAAVVDQITALGTEVVRIAGNDRFETAALLAQQIFGSATDIVIASGVSFPDGLVGGVLGRPLLLVPAPGVAVPNSVLAAVDSLGAEFLTVMGGTGAVSDAHAAQVGAAR